MVCLLVAIFSSYKLLAVPDLKPGDIAPFNEIAPRDAIVIDTQALKEKEKSLKETFVQVIDKNQSKNLEEIIDNQINQLRKSRNNRILENINNLDLTDLEKRWLIKVSNNEFLEWEEEIKKASKKMLSQGIINTLALDHLNEASSLQLIDLGIKDSPNRSIGTKILSNSFYQKSNLKIDTLKTNNLLENLSNRVDIHEIKVNKGSIITKKGQSITSQ